LEIPRLKLGEDRVKQRYNAPSSGPMSRPMRRNADGKKGNSLAGNQWLAISVFVLVLLGSSARQKDVGQPQ